MGNKQYQPSNGTEGMIFFANWCEHCSRDKVMSEGRPFDDCDDSDLCDIIARSMANKPGDPEYPKEWVYGDDGQPMCTAFLAEPAKPCFKNEFQTELFTN